MDDGIELGKPTINPVRSRPATRRDTIEEALSKTATAAPVQQQRLDAADVAAVAVVLSLTGGSVVFQVLCVVDAQCLGDDPAAGPLRAGIIPSLVAVAAVAPLLLRAAAVARKPSDRRPLVVGVVLACVFCVFFVIVAIQQGERLVSENFRRAARRMWRRCDAEAAPDGVWVERGSCDSTNAVRVHYKTHAALARRTRRNLDHFLASAAALGGLFFWAAVALATALRSHEAPLKMPPPQEEEGSSSDDD